MNDIIKQLLHESIDNCDGTMTDRTYSLKSSELQKFAELIVQDCLALVEKRTGGAYEITMTPETRRAWNIWIEIKEHFGVK